MKFFVAMIRVPTTFPKLPHDNDALVILEAPQTLRIFR